MTKLFYLSEILKFAVEKEKQSEELYLALAQRTEDADCKNMFAKLAQDEIGHKDFYEKMLAEAASEQTPGVKEDEEYMAYMQELIAESRHAEPLSAIIDGDDINAILSYAVAREKDSVLFYAGLKNFVPPKNKEYIDKIIAEEAKHAALLIKLKMQ